MSKPRSPRLFVQGTTFDIIERPGYVKANLHGAAGWTSVYATDISHLPARVKYARDFADQLRKVRWVRGENQ